MRVEDNKVNLILGAGIIAIAVMAILRRVDVRLVLFVAALALGLVAMNPQAIIQVFFQTFSNERFVVPIGCAMGFAYTLRHTGCDQHLVHLLVKPLTKVRWLLIPGTVVVGFIVNIPIISQTSTAASLGPVVIPILLAARLRPVTIGAVLLLGCSIGGELLNPGAPELRTIVGESHKLALKQQQTENDDTWMKKMKGLDEHRVVQRILPLDLLALTAATALFWLLSKWETSRHKDEASTETIAGEEADTFRVNYVKAAIPFLPLALLFLTGPPLSLIHVPHNWLVSVPQVKLSATQQLQAALTVQPAAGFPSALPWTLLAYQDKAPELPPALTGLYNSRLIGLAMLIGVVAAAAISGRQALQVPRQFFEGAGYAFANIISLIVTANCFGEGIKQIGLAKAMGDLIQLFPVVLLPASGALSALFAALSGSGMATTQSLFEFFAAPGIQQDVDPTLVGAVVALSAAAGRTMSPVAAVCLMCATLTNTNPFDLAKRVALPLALGVAVVVIGAFVLGAI